MLVSKTPKASRWFSWSSAAHDNMKEFHAVKTARFCNCSLAWFRRCNCGDRSGSQVFFLRKGSRARPGRETTPEKHRRKVLEHSFPGEQDPDVASSFDDLSDRNEAAIRSDLNRMHQSAGLPCELG